MLIIVKKLEKCEHKVYGKIFKGTICMLIASMREVTRIFQNDEIDVHLSLREDYKTRSKFDRDGKHYIWIMNWIMNWIFKMTG